MEKIPETHTKKEQIKKYMETIRSWHQALEDFSYTDIKGNEFVFEEKDWQTIFLETQSGGTLPSKLLVRSVPFHEFEETILQGKTHEIKQTSNVPYANAAQFDSKGEGIKIALAEGRKDMPAVCVYGFTPPYGMKVRKDIKREHTYITEGKFEPTEVKFVLLRAPTQFTPKEYIEEDDRQFQFLAWKLKKQEEYKLS